MRMSHHTGLGGVTIGEASASMAGDVEIPIGVTIPAVSFLYEEEPG